MLTIVTFFTALPKKAPMRCKDAALPDSLVRNHSVKRLGVEKIVRNTYKILVSLFKILALHLHEIEQLEEKLFKFFNVFPEKNWRD